ncbi:M20/M25/M40 family metallo-hydrolase, partial [Hungatella effluvii]
MDEAEHAAALLCEKTNAEMTRKNDYYGYRYLKDSPLRDIMDRVFFKEYGILLNHVAAHGGNECGAFKHMFPDMDIVTSGAIYAGHHTPDEYLDLESFDRSIHFLKALIRQL